jgi:hypothetical protein
MLHENVLNLFNLKTVLIFGVHYKNSTFKYTQFSGGLHNLQK